GLAGGELSEVQAELPAAPVGGEDDYLALDGGENAGHGSGRAHDLITPIDAIESMVKGLPAQPRQAVEHLLVDFVSDGGRNRPVPGIAGDLVAIKKLLEIHIHPFEGRTRAIRLMDFGISPCRLLVVPEKRALGRCIAVSTVLPPILL